MFLATKAHNILISHTHVWSSKCNIEGTTEIRRTGAQALGVRAVLLWKFEARARGLFVAEVVEVGIQSVIFRRLLS
jgi:hypothetical protein